MDVTLESGSTPRDGERGWARIGPLVFTLAAMLGTHPYQYGLGNTTITIPFVKAFADASLYAGDALVGERFHLQTILWPLLGLLVRWLTIDVSVLFLLGYAVATWFTFVALDRLAIAMFGDRRVGIVAACFLVLRRPSLGGGVLMESFFDTVVVAQPLVLMAFAHAFGLRWRAAFAFLGVAFSIHGLTAAHAAFAVILAWSVITRHAPLGERARALATQCLLPLLLAASPVLAWRFVEAPPSLHLLAADPEWLQILAIRSPHHVFPSTWALREFLEEGAAFVVLLVGFSRLTANPPTARDRIARGLVAGVGVLFLLGYVFSELAPVAIVVQFQLFRSSTILRLLEVLYFAAMLRDAIVERRGISLVLVPALALALFVGGDLFRAASVVFCGFVTICAIAVARSPRERTWVLAACGYAVVLAIVGAQRAGFSFPVRPEVEWREVQSRVRKDTPQDSWFIAPPDLSLADFRAGSERTVFASWKDGTQSFFDPAFGVEWLRRMRLLANEPESASRPVREDAVSMGYPRLDAAALRRIASEPWTSSRPVYVVRVRDGAALGLELLFQTAHYEVLRVRP